MIQAFAYHFIILIIIKNCATDKVLNILIPNPQCSGKCKDYDFPGKSCSASIGVEIKVNPSAIDICLPDMDVTTTGHDDFCPKCEYSRQIKFNENGTTKSNAENDLIVFPDKYSNNISSVYVYMHLKKEDRQSNPENTPPPNDCKIYNGSAMWTEHKLNLTSSNERCELQFWLNYSCATNFYGKNCEVFCQSKNDSSGHYLCKEDGEKHCMADYFGENCSQYHFCSSSPCYNNGSCSNVTDDYICECPPGFSGRNCSIDIDECLSNPCLNGSCHDRVNSFLCSCDPDFAGSICNEKVDDCIGITCVHGKCIDGINNYTCECEEGYTGRNCNQSVDDCVGNMCMNGTCLDIHNNYSCVCYPDYTGRFCDRWIDDCLNNSCIHGTCIDGIHNYTEVAVFKENFYTCSCNFGYTGKMCDLAISIPDSKSTTSAPANTASTAVSAASKSFIITTTSRTSIHSSSNTILNGQTGVSRSSSLMRESTISLFSSKNSDGSISSTASPESSQSTIQKFLKSTTGKIVIVVVVICVIILLVGAFVCYRRRTKNGRREERGMDKVYNGIGPQHNGVENGGFSREKYNNQSLQGRDNTLANGTSHKTEESDMTHL